jgi:hypothetical protein
MMHQDHPEALIDGDGEAPARGSAKRPDITFAVAACVLLDRLDFAFFANRFPDQRFNPIKAIEHDRMQRRFY